MSESKLLQLNFIEFQKEPFTDSTFALKTMQDENESGSIQFKYSTQSKSPLKSKRKLKTLSEKIVFNEEIEKEYRAKYESMKKFKINLPEKGFRLNLTIDQKKTQRTKSQISGTNHKDMIKTTNQSQHQDFKNNLNSGQSSPDNKLKSLKLSRQKIYNQFLEEENSKVGKLINLDLVNQKNGAIIEVFQHQEGSFDDEYLVREEPVIKRGQSRASIIRASSFISNQTLKQISLLKLGETQIEEQNAQVRKVSRKEHQRMKTEVSENNGFTQFYENAYLYRINTIGDSTITNKQKKLRAEQKTNNMLPSEQKSFDQFQILKKQVDKEFLHLLVLCWSNEGDFKPIKKDQNMLPKTLKQQNVISKFKEISRVLLKFLQKMNRCKITSSEMVENWRRINIQKSYQTEGSYYFLRSVKYNCFNKVEQIIAKYGRFFVLDFDHIGRTSLHLACSEGNMQIITLLLQKGADTEAEDFLGRTPLYYAIKGNHIGAVKSLLQAKCNPFSKTTHYRALATDSQISKLIQISQKVKSIFLS